MIVAVTQHHWPKSRRGLTVALAAGCWLLGVVCASSAMAQLLGSIDDAPWPGVEPAGIEADTVERIHVTAAPRAHAEALEVSGDRQRTHVVLRVDRPIVASIFTLAAPYRAIVDIADLDFRLPAGTGASPVGNVTAFRFGVLEPGRSRIVVDTAGPVRIEGAAFEAPTAGVGGRPTPGRLTFDLVTVSVAHFAGFAESRDPRPPAPPGLPLSSTAGSGRLRTSLPLDADAGAVQLRSGAPQANRPDARLPEPIPPESRQTDPGSPAPPLTTSHVRPVIVIDPGHGGLDPGTISDDNLYEKTVVLAVARQLAAQLRQSRRYDVLLTRTSDAFVSLDRRLAISAERAADLFVSIHADSLSEKGAAQSVRGATIYVLSERASDETAHLLAEKENAVDRLAGLDVVPASDESQVRDILIDLVRRETSSHAIAFRKTLIGALRATVPLSKDPERSAAFKVLKQSRTPAVLIELGYMSNREDLAHLAKPEWQRQVAGAIATAIDVHFAVRTPPAEVGAVR